VNFPIRSRSSEPDVMGYRVFLSNMAEGDFVQITTTWINDTVYHYGSFRK
jgi:hypothetical protein